MILCTECGYENIDNNEVCTECGASLKHCSENGLKSPNDDIPVDMPPTPDMVHYTLPLSISASDAHLILFNWLEKQHGENFRREDFNILRMNKKYYGCWLLWYAIPDEGSDSENSGDVFETADQILSMSGKRKKTLIISGNEDFPVEIHELSSYYDFMDMCILDNKILASSEYITITKTEKAAYDESLELLKREELQVFDNKDKLSSKVKLLHRLPIGLPVWEGAYDFRGGKECAFFINGQSGNLVGEEFPGDKKDYPFKIVPFAIFIFFALIILLFFLFFSAGNRTNIQNHDAPPSSIQTTIPEIIPSLSTSSPTGAQESIPPSVSISPSVVLSISASPSIPAALSSIPREQSVVSSPSVPVSQSIILKSADTDKETVLSIVNENFNAIKDKDFNRVYNLRTERIRKVKNPAYYKKLYSDNIMVTVIDARVNSSTGKEAHVSVTLSSKDIISGVNREGTYEGWFFLKKEGSDWRIEDSGLKPTKYINKNIH